MAREEHHVVPNPNGGWDVKKNGVATPVLHTELKQDAIDQGRVISQVEKTEFIIHGLDGQIQQSDSHGNDPVESKG